MSDKKEEKPEREVAGTTWKDVEENTKAAEEAAASEESE